MSGTDSIPVGHVHTIFRDMFKSEYVSLKVKTVLCMSTNREGYV